MLNRLAQPRAALLAILLPLAGCGGTPALESFGLSSSSFNGPARAARGQLVVAQPLATSPTDSDRIIVRTTPDTQATLKGAQWVEPLPRLLQTRLVQSFENARLLRSVGRQDGKIQADYTLTSEIRRFEIDLTSGEAIAEISVKLIIERTGRIAAAQVFLGKAPGAAGDGVSAATALDQALGQTLRQIVTWTASRI